MSDCLIDRARRGDKQAVSLVMEQHKPKVKTIARRYFLMGGDLDDLVQEGMIGLFNAINTFDPAKSGNFEAFACLCIKREIINCIKRNNTDKTKLLNNVLPLDEISENAFEVVSPEKAVLDREDDIWLEGVLDKTLSKMEKKVVSAFINGFSYTEIAQNNGVSVKAVDNALQRARVKLAKFLQR